MLTDNFVLGLAFICKATETTSTPIAGEATGFMESYGRQVLQEMDAKDEIN